MQPTTDHGVTPGVGSAARRGTDVLVGAALVALAAILRLPNLVTRGTWDGDQGHDMLVLRSWVQDGIIPLLGPPTSIGDVHHGALYYYLLAPAAFLTGGDSPLAVVLEIALAGIAAVAVTWWLARSIAGPVAGLVAGLLLAVSTSAVDGSTFIWNPNLIALSSAVALAGAWRAWSTHRTRWWILAAVGTAVTVQCHVLGVAMVPIVGALLVADWRRVDGEARTAVGRAGLGWIVIVALSYLPLVVHEVSHDFSELQAALAYLRAGGDVGAAGPLERFPIVSLRVISWPLAGLITEAVIPALLAAVAVIAIVILRWRAPRPDERLAVRWLGLGLLWTCGFLTVAAPSLAVVIPELPNDHYHAFADPMVVILLGLGAAAAWDARAPGPQRLALRVVAGAGIAAVCAWNLSTQPPAVNPDGGFPAAADAGARIVASTGDEVVEMVSLPDFKSVEAYAYPVIRSGRQVNGAAVDIQPGNLVIVCDARFEVAIGAACDGPAEDALAASGRPDLALADRFEAAPGRFISVYLASP
jgi:4-amino-4-deoxy-L-arabinose transferase-like glycosyltransferase